MIRLREATTLALTKLRTRKIRLTVTIVISGLLFSGLAAASMVAHGVIGSIGSFSKEGLGSRYIAQAYPQAAFNFMSDKSVTDRAIAIQKDTIARKKAAAKQLGISYDATSDPGPIIQYDTPGGQKQSTLNPSHAAAKQAVQEYMATHPLPDQASLAAVAKPYQSTAIYESRQISYDLGGASLQVLKDGKESFDQNSTGKNGPPSGTDSFVTSWSAMSGGLLQPFILPGQNLGTGQDDSIPIIVPNSAAEQILGLKALPASATSSERLARTKELRAKAPQVHFSVCYRNSTSANLVSQAVSTAQEIELNKNKKGYQKPELIYGLPATPCGSVPVSRDVRSKEEKTLADKQRQFDEMFGAEPAAQATFTFRIVGIVPDPDYGGPAFGVGQIIRSLVSSSLGNGWYMPYDQLTANPLIGKLFNQQTVFGGVPGYYAEFGTADQARRFIEKENCNLDYGKIGAGQDPAEICNKQGHPFSISAFGSNSLALESAKRGFGKFFRIAALVVSGIATIIMMGTIGRMIADSRRETAVFRAIGAKKMDIAQIYVTYAIFLSLLISLFAILFGLTLAMVANHHWSPEATVQAILAYNSQDLNKSFNLYALYVPDLLILTGLSLAAGMLSTSFPLIRNLRRNPIRDMRDDT
ncbi:MAG TPA: ABC transporter permease [Candidatus Pristimantibacillus sp.]|nr:ABC transporter permease [Candidatus Pristimantibacillus sp.]